jgi:enoyl-CoA hydratase
MTITINRPAQLNALNSETINELNKALSLADVNPEVRVIIMTGAGDKSFVAGADIKEFAHFNLEEGKMLSARGHKLLFDFVENMSKPVIAAVNGFALGGGLELAMACHLRVASDQAWPSGSKSRCHTGLRRNPKACATCWQRKSH